MQQSYTANIRDMRPGEAPSHELALKFNVSDVRLRDIIAERVRMEVDLYLQHAAQSFANNLVQPGEAESRLNHSKRHRQPLRIDVEKQIEIALRAFERNGFFVLVDDQQVTDLDDLVSLAEDPEICFFKLTPLVGG